MTMSASFARRRTISLPSSAFRFTVTDFLLRACTAHQSDVPPASGYSLRHLRSGSPPLGSSILMTSAPNSPRKRAANGPAISVPSSSTLTPESGPGPFAADAFDWESGESCEGAAALMVSPFVLFGVRRHDAYAAIEAWRDATSSAGRAWPARW